MADGVKIKIHGDDSGFKSTMDKLGGVAKGAMGVAIGAVTAVTGALVAGATQVVRLGAEFEQTAAKASTLFGNVAVDTENLNRKMLDLSSATGVAATELNEGLYAALSSGVPVTEDMAEATEFMAGAAKLAKAGFTSVNTAVEATAKTLNAYGMGTSEAGRIQGILIQTQNKGITTVDELGASLAQVTPTAAAFGVSFEEVGASLATMTAQGTPTAQATTQLNSLIAELGKNGTVAANNLASAAEGSKYAGMSFSEMMKNGATLDEVLGMMNKSAEDSGLSMVDMFSSIEAGKSALSLFNKDGETYRQNLASMADTTGVVDEAYEKMSNTFQSQSSRIKETLKNLGISIYNENNSTIANMAGFVADMVSQLSKAYSEGGLEGMVSAIGDVLNQVILKIAEHAPKFIDMAVKLLQTLVKGLIDNSAVIANSAVTILMSLVDGILALLPMLLELGLKLLLSLATGITAQLPTLIPTIVGVLMSMVQLFIDNLPLLVKAGCDLLTGLAQGVVNAIPVIIESLPKIIDGIINFFVTGIPMLIDCGIQLLTSLVGALPVIINAIVAVLPTLINSLITALLNMLPMLIDCGIQLFTSIISNLPVIIATIAKSMPGIVKAIINGFMSVDWAGLGKNIIDGIINGLKSAGKALLDAIKNIAKMAFDGIKDFFGIKSPSTLMRDVIGKNLSLGIAVGVDEEADSVTNSVGDLGNVAVKTAKKSFSKDFLSEFKQSIKGVEAQIGVAMSNITPALAKATNSSVQRTETIETINRNTVQTLKIIPNNSKIYDIVIEEKEKRGETI